MRRTRVFVWIFAMSQLILNPLTNRFFWSQTKLAEHLFFHFSTLLALKISTRCLEIFNFFPDSTYIYQVALMAVFKIHGAFR